MFPSMEAVQEDLMLVLLALLFLQTSSSVWGCERLGKGNGRLGLGGIHIIFPPKCLKKFLLGRGFSLCPCYPSILLGL